MQLEATHVCGITFQYPPIIHIGNKRNDMTMINIGSFNVRFILKFQIPRKKIAISDFLEAICSSLNFSLIR